MDVSLEWNHLVKHIGTLNTNTNEDRHHSLQRRSPTPFLINASQLLTQINTFETLLHAIYEDYIDYHGSLPLSLCYSLLLRPKTRTSFTDDDRRRLSQEIALFLTTLATEINELRRSITMTTDTSLNNYNKHQREIISYLLERLSSFAKQSQNMEKERKRFYRNPYKLHSSQDINTRSIKNNNKNDSNKSNNFDFKLKHNNNVSDSNKLSKSFAERYDDEIAPQSKLKEYKHLTEKHKAICEKDTKMLNAKFSEDVQETMKMETAVEQISYLLSEFVNILQAQSEQVKDLEGTGKVATEHVLDTDKELILTIQRSASHQRNMVFLSVGLAILLLILDYITP